MTYDELISEVAHNTGLGLTLAELAIQYTFAHIGKEVREHHGKIKIPRFGIFEARLASARVVMNPRTKKKISVPERWRPHFRASKFLKERS